MTKFKSGDKVIVTKPIGLVTVGSILTISMTLFDRNYFRFDTHPNLMLYSDEIELYRPISEFYEKTLDK